MAAIYETGHAKNVANFQHLIAFATGYGAAYNPSKSSLTLTALNDLHTLAQSKLADVTARNTTYNNAINERLTAFSDLRPLATRLVNALDATEATPEKIKEAKAYNRKLQGTRAGTPQTPTDPNAPAPSTISVSQQSYDQKIQHFAGLISVLDSEPTYTPNEAELKILALNAKQNDLSAKNTSVSNAYTTISNTRISRDKTLYNPNEGLVDVAAEVKKYVKSVFGASSPEFAQIKGIIFTKPKK